MVVLSVPRDILHNCNYTSCSLFSQLTSHSYHVVSGLATAVNVMTDEPFSAEYFQHLLTSLTLNSRALIVELTGLAEKHIDNANEIVQLIEERISKILPKYKLYAFYLMDSIIKNIGNPYNLLFAKNLYKSFTETYLIVDDSATRQNMINLFKTWMSGKTLAGLDLFPHDILRKMEEFIIKATSLSNGASLESSKITRDAILREGNYLLQYIIAMDEDLDKFESQSSKGEKTPLIAKWRLERNNMIYDINVMSEAVMSQHKDDFEAKKEGFAEKLQGIRRALDEQSVQQQELLRGVVQLPKLLDEVDREEIVPHIDLQPKNIDVVVILGEQDEQFDSFVKSWGKVQTETSSMFSQAQSLVSLPVRLEATETPASLADSLGLNVASFDFQNSMLGFKETTPDLQDPADDSEDGDGYNPEDTYNDMEMKHSPPASSAAFSGKSNLKRAAPAGEEKVVKRVRFDI